MARLVYAILEIAVPANHGNGRRHLAPLDTLRHSSFGGHAVLGVVSEANEEPCHVPDFGHNCRCKCEHPEPWGVDRYFGLSLVLDGEPTLADICGPYWLQSGVSRVELCGLTVPESDCVERERIGASRTVLTP